MRTKSTKPFLQQLSDPFALSRRSFLQALLSASTVFAVPGFALASQEAPIIRGHGQIRPPEPVPDVKLVSQEGASTRLLDLVEGHATAVQLMFTSCTTTCPIQAAIFQRVQTKLPDMAARKLQLLSLSIDPKTDTPKALSAWLRRFHAGPTWIAAAPAVADAQRVQDFFGKGSDSSDHSNQVSILDRQGRLVWRTFELPAAEEIIGVLQKF
jgi:protein SCO1